MIVTLTLNPSLDRTLEVAALRPGHVLRATSVRIDPGGKGVNVTRALRAFGIASRAVLPYGGSDGRELLRLLAADGVPVVAVPMAGRTRSNVTLVEADGTSTKINEPGTPLAGDELAALADAVLRAGDALPSWAVLCGSIPPGVASDVYTDLTARFAAHGIRVAIDTSGPGLVAALRGHPDLIKPNREELAAAVGVPLRDVADVVKAAERLRAQGARAVLATLGPHGAVLVDEAGARLCLTDPVEPRSTVGAGDALLAGFLAAGATGEGALTQAVAWGRAAVGLPGSRMPGPDDVSREGLRVVPDPGGEPVCRALPVL